MKQFFPTLMALACSAFIMTAQNTREVVINMEEDPSDITTIADIIRLEETDSQVSMTPCESSQTSNSFIKVGYNFAKLMPKHEINIGYNYNQDLVPAFKADWGVSFQTGHIYKLHTLPVAGILRFNIDATYADVNFNHYKTEPGEKLYNSSQQWSVSDADGNTSASYYFIPWCLEKYEANIGISAGPSITLDAFRNHATLHNLTFNIFYHIGYHASLLWMQNDIARDANPRVSDADSFNPVNDAAKFNYGYGFINSFGLNINWNIFGIGIEKRYGYLDYLSFQKKIYGNSKYRFIDDSTRLYLSINF